MNKQAMKLRKFAFGFALGLTWSAGVVIMAIINAFCPDWGNDMIKLLGNVYLGYDESIKGMVLGALWAFGDGFIGGFFIALFYNLCLCCCKSKQSNCCHPGDCVTKNDDKSNS